MANTRAYLNSAISGCQKLARILKCLDEEACPKCGHSQRLSDIAAQELDGKVWEAVRFAEAHQ